MTDPIGNGNGNNSLPPDGAGVINLNPNDKYLIIKLDEVNKQITTMPSPALSDPLEQLALAHGGMAATINLMAQAKQQADSRIISLPPGSRLRKP